MIRLGHVGVSGALRVLLRLFPDAELCIRNVPGGVELDLRIDASAPPVVIVDVDVSDAFARLLRALAARRRERRAQ